MHRRNLALATLLAALALVVTLGLPAGAQGPFQDDTHEPCLGPSDPFCQPTDGGGSSTTTCKKCSLTSTWVKCSLDSQGRGDTCTATINPDNTISCQVEGKC